MKFMNVSVYIFVLLAAFFASASESTGQFDLTAQPAGTEMVLIDEGSLSQPAGNVEKDGIWAQHFKVVGSGRIEFSYIPLGLRVGVATKNEAIEAGLDAGAFMFVAFLYGGGPYVQVAPLPGRGRQFYAFGRAYRAWIMGPPKGNIDTWDARNFGLGWKIKKEGRVTSYIEVGRSNIKRNYSKDCVSDEDNKCPPLGYDHQKTFVFTYGLRF